MALGRLLTRQRRTAQNNRGAGANFQVIIDGNPVNFPLQWYRGGMGIPGAWRSALLIADLLGSIPWDAYREDANGMPVDKLTPRPWLLEQPAPPDPRVTTYSSLALDLIWHGNAVGLWADRDQNGMPTAVLPIPAEQVGIRRVGREAISQLPVGAVEYLIGGQSYGTDEVLHIKGPCPPSEIRGFGVLEAHLNGSGTLDLAQELAKQAVAVGDAGVPTGVLTSSNPDLSQEEAEEMKKAWLKSQQTRTIAVLAAADFKPVAWNPSEMQLIEARKMSLLELALVFGVPPSFLGVETSNRTYRNDNAEDVKFAKWGLRGHVARFEQTLSLAFPPGVCVTANMDDITRADLLTRMQAHEIAGRARIELPNEARAVEGRPPIPGGDEFPALTNPAAPAVADSNGDSNGDTDDEETEDNDG